ncbi:hypothetical protein SAMN05216337_105048 [Bradyrhizobium brasilense]|uniref:Uncharacterized protein n=1 Tax=Bradyrhizobium brasilense TaxID=1419277 RepID=A0A1G7JXJ1_9BRAD|nr:hypothetical protein SAMN05216337_105048 [Bradyrhizobium brasilense]
MKMFLVLAAALSVALVASSPCLARAGGGAHSYGGGARSAATFRATPVMRSAPGYRAPPAARLYVPRQQYAHPRYVPAIYTRSTVHRLISVSRNPTYANPVRRAPERFVRFHGRMIGVPPLAGLTAPAIVEVPDLGEVIVPLDMYTTVYPLLISDDESDRESAITQLRERAERDPASLVQRSAAVSIPPMNDPCPNCQDDKVEVLHTCRPIGECDMSERLVNSSKNPTYLVPERGSDRRGLIF